jgi:hypothetical protein
MRAMNNNLIITPYAEFKHLDVTKIKIKEPNHLFDIDPTKRNPYKRTPIYVTKCFSIMLSSICFILADGC